MTTSFLNLDQGNVSRKQAALAGRENSLASVAARVVEGPPSSSETVAQEPSEFELVFSRRQIASTSLLAIVVLAVVSGVSYLIGKSAALGSMTGAAPPRAVAAIARPASAPPAIPVSAPASTTEKPPPSQSAPPAPLESSGTSASPVFQEAENGKLYLQVGAIDKGLAGIWAEGLRTHGLNAFVASGPSEKVWRVLIGPLADQAAYRQAKDALTGLGISNFGRISN